MGREWRAYGIGGIACLYRRREEIRKGIPGEKGKDRSTSSEKW